MQCYAALVLVCALLVADSQAQFLCEDERCFLRSADAEKTPFFSLDTAELSGRCLAQCALEVLGSNDPSVVTVSGVWRSVEESALRTRNPYPFKLCTLGCRLGKTFSPDTNLCTDTCVQTCKASCANTRTCGNFNPDQCRAEDCNTGCQVYSDRLNVFEDMTLTRPAPPISFSVSRDATSAGVFVITALANLSNMTASEENITAYIFRVEYEKETSYVLQSSITDDLDLSFFTCEEVNLSLAVVNINGSSEFTSPTPICVHGVPPLAPGNFRVTSIVDDLRPEFFGHAVISLGWDMPEGVVAYELLVRPAAPFGFPGMCGDRVNFSIDANATTYTLMASNSSSFFLQFGIDGQNSRQCTYRLRLTSVPGGKRSNIQVRFREHPRVTSPKPPPVDMSCSGVTDDQTGLYNIRMEFSYPNVSLINEAINNYSIIIRNRNFSVGIPPIAPLRETLELHNVLNGRLIQQSLKDVYICADGVASFTIELTERGENIAVVFTVDNFCPQAVTTTLFILLHFTPNLTAGPWWRPLPEPPMMCTISLDIVPPSPVPVGSIELLQDLPLPLEITDNNQRVLDRFNLSWSTPLEPRGDIQQYVVFVGFSLLQEGTDTCGFETATNGNETTIAIENFIIPFNPPACLYVQIRSIGEFAGVRSNWSDPFFIPIEDGYTAINCSFMPIVPTDSEVSSFRAGVIAESVIIFFLIPLVIALCV